MPPTPPAVENEYESSVNIQFLLMILIAMIMGLLAAILLLPTWLPNMAAIPGGHGPKSILVSFTRHGLRLAQHPLAFHGPGTWHHQQNGTPLARCTGRLCHP